MATPEPSPAELPQPTQPPQPRPCNDIHFHVMVIHALLFLEPQNHSGSTFDEIEHRLGLFYILPTLHRQLMVKSLQTMVRSNDIARVSNRYVVVYSGKLYKKFVSVGAGGLRLNGPGGALPYMCDYQYMIMHALKDTEPYYPEGLSVHEIADHIRLLYECLPYSHSLQVQTWLNIMVKRDVLRTTSGRYINQKSSEEYINWWECGGGRCSAFGNLRV